MNKETKIRQATITDKDDLFPLILSSQLFQKQKLEKENIVQRQEYEKSVLKSFNKWFGDEDKMYFVAVEDDKIVGFIFCMLDKIVSNSSSLSDLYVIPEKRKRGIATELIKRGITWSKDNKVGEINLAVSRNNASAIEAYQKQGFVEAEDDYLYMEKKLK